MNTFNDFGLSKPTMSAIEAVGYVTPTEIQSKSIGVILSARDLMASAETGSGKTAAFAIPLIEMLEAPDPSIRAVILVPTRELALQVTEEMGRLSRNAGLRIATIYGGTGYASQMQQLKRGADVIVATPGRLFDFIERKLADLSRVEFLVLDEADRMLDMGFMPQVRRIVRRIPTERQTLMFSATIDRRVERLAAEFLNEPATIRTNSERIEPVAIEQRIYHVHEFGKDALLLKVLSDFRTGSILIFTQTRRKAAWVTERLRDAGVPAEELHGDIGQKQREDTLARYRRSEFTVLVATDVAARGLDIPDISCVVNYDLPLTAADYVHRIGRTGRAGRSGLAISFVDQDQRYLIRDIEKVIGRILDPNSPSPSPLAASARRFGSGRRRRIV